MGRPWIKLRTSMLNNPKYGILSDGAYILFLNMLVYSSIKDTNGYIGKIRYETWPRKSSLIDLCNQVTELQDSGVIRLDTQGDIWIAELGEIATIGQDFSRKSLSDSERNYIHHRDNYKCVYCGEPSQHVDHVIPVSKGGTNDLDNLVAACSTCNLAKSDKLLSELGWTIGGYDG